MPKIYMCFLIMLQHMLLVGKIRIASLTHFNKLSQLALPSEECLVMLGDFNARVGSRVNQDDDWWYERAPHGHGVLNESGRELLSFLSINEATVLVSKESHSRTDLATSTLCHHEEETPQEMHGCHCNARAQCNIDHMMLKIKLQFGRKNFKSRCSGRLMEKYDVLKLQGKSVDDKGRTTTRGKFENEVCERIQKE